MILLNAARYADLQNWEPRFGRLYYITTARKAAFCDRANKFRPEWGLHKGLNTQLSFPRRKQLKKAELLALASCISFDLPRSLRLPKRTLWTDKQRVSILAGARKNRTSGTVSSVWAFLRCRRPLDVATSRWTSWDRCLQSQGKTRFGSSRGRNCKS